jgi:hypothetical protein
MILGESQTEDLTFGRRVVGQANLQLHPLVQDIASEFKLGRVWAVFWFHSVHWVLSGFCPVFIRFTRSCFRRVSVLSRFCPVLVRFCPFDSFASVSLLSGFHLVHLVLSGSEQSGDNTTIKSEAKDLSDS